MFTSTIKHHLITKYSFNSFRHLVKLSYRFFTLECLSTEAVPLLHHVCDKTNFLDSTNFKGKIPV